MNEERKKMYQYVTVTTLVQHVLVCDYYIHTTQARYIYICVHITDAYTMYIFSCAASLHVSMHLQNFKAQVEMQAELARQKEEQRQSSVPASVEFAEYGFSPTKNVQKQTCLRTVFTTFHKSGDRRSLVASRKPCRKHMPTRHPQS